MDKNYYVNQLTTEDFMELFKRITLLVEQNDRIIRVEYCIQTPTRRIVLAGTKPFCTLFLKDFTCSLTSCQSKSVKEQVKQIYKDFMLERFKGTNYENEFNAYHGLTEADDCGV